ncbi:MAG: DUF1565 domain-containing protein [Phycisphaerales bacterium]|nr:DUF1565 domain-containing protein [Planctomycetota bacterium]MBL6997500.1 DUF1565 domain-containing protein [Phycisphaerales bacterium]
MLFQIVISLLLTLAGNALAEVIYVDADRGGWKTTYSTLHDALKAAKKGDEIWVANGTYKTNGSSFQMVDGVNIIGGFSGNERSKNSSDPDRNATILDGEGKTDHVVIGANDASLTGFTITGGNARRNGERGGRDAGRGSGGQRRPPRGLQGRPPTRGDFGQRGGSHTTPDQIAQSGGAGAGGGMLNFGVSPEVIDCIFIDNRAGKGGGVYNANNASPIFRGCTFENNSSERRGGGVTNDLQSSPQFIDCTFIGNSCNEKGGGLYNDFMCSPKLEQCLFVNNTAGTRGGAMANDGSSSPVLIHCTITDNTANDLGGGLYQGTYKAGGSGCNPTLIDCIVWGNHATGYENISNWHDDIPIIVHSDIGGGALGEGNLDINPKFTSNYSLKQNSPCLEASTTKGPIGKTTK